MTPIESIIASTLIVAGIFDIRERKVHDAVWLASLAVIIPTLVLFYTSSLWMVLLRLAFLFPVLIVFTQCFQIIGEADEIALAVMMLDPSPLADVYAIFFALAVAAAHYAYLRSQGLLGTKYITHAEFEREKRWIKKEEKNGMVGAVYSAPAIAYFAIGYCLSLVQSYIVLF